ncbi:hypothetical protein C5167_012301 [Papaver somniferum]|uniref:Phosphatidic acid phosphatase type 2/haloperoxidase domain-containing protein n=1 Tax=Papaver somniferum TaxID=3469 RepID=A0A4Y7IXX0_PAPSO|nr:hypothetical protein C5167_012301 [Papaver somniferum]
MSNSIDESSKSTTTTAKNSYLTSLISLDTKLSLQIHTLCTPIPRSILKALEISGDGRVWIPIPIAFLLYPLSKNSNDNLQSIFIGLLVGFITDLIFVGFFKYTIRRPRPVYNKGMKLTVSVDHWSFPSGHSSRVWFISFYLYLSSAAASIGSDGDGDFQQNAFFARLPAECIFQLWESKSNDLLHDLMKIPHFMGGHKDRATPTIVVQSIKECGDNENEVKL